MTGATYTRPMAVELPSELRDLLDAGPLCHLATINADGSPQVTVIWVGREGNELRSAHLDHRLKLRNIERDSRVVLSFEAPRELGVFLNPYAVLKARATVEPSEGAWDLLDRLGRVYVGTDFEFPAPRKPGYVVRYEIERIGGVGPWVPDRS